MKEKRPGGYTSAQLRERSGGHHQYHAFRIYRISK